MTIIMPESQCQNNQRLCFYDTNKPFSDVKYFWGAEDTAHEGGRERETGSCDACPQTDTSFVIASSCNCSNCKMYLSKLQNVFA